VKQSVFQEKASFGNMEEGHRVKSLHVSIWEVGCTKEGIGCGTSMLKIKGGIVTGGFRVMFW